MVRLDAGGPRPAGGGGRRGPRPGMRHPGHRRQLLLLHRPRRPAPRLPARGDLRGRLGRHHQTPRHRRSRHHRHRHRPTPLRDPGGPLSGPGRDRPPGHRPADRRRHRPRTHLGSARGAPAGLPQGGRHPDRRLAQRGGLRPDRPGHRGEGRTGPVPARRDPGGRGRRRLDPGPDRPRGRRHGGDGERPAAPGGPRPVPGPGRPCPDREGRRTGPRQLPGLPRLRPTRPGPAVRGLLLGLRPRGRGPAHRSPPGRHPRTDAPTAAAGHTPSPAGV